MAFEWIPRYPDYYAEEEGGLLEGRYISSPVFESASELPPEWRDKAEFSPYYTDIPVSWREIQDWGGYGRISDWDWELIEERRSRGAVGWEVRRRDACSLRAWPRACISRSTRRSSRSFSAAAASLERDCSSAASSPRSPRVRA